MPVEYSHVMSVVVLFCGISARRMKLTPHTLKGDSLYQLCPRLGDAVSAACSDETYKPPGMSTSPTAIFWAGGTRSGHSSHTGSKRRTTSVVELRQADARNWV